MREGEGKRGERRGGRERGGGERGRGGEERGEGRGGGGGGGGGGEGGGGGGRGGEGEEGRVRLLTSQPDRHGQLARVLRRIHTDYAGDLDVATLAREANMGVSTFHHAFRDATATTPLQYVKRIRLHRARALLMTEALNAQDASRRVGYASASQFSREYRRMFGASPASERAAASA